MTTELVYVHHTLDTAFNTVSLLLNGFLFFLVRRYSTFPVAIHKKMLTVSCVIDFTLSAVVLVVQPVAVMADGYFVMFSNGFLADVSHNTSAALCGLFSLFTYLNITWIAVQFVCRYRCLCRGSDSDKIIFSRRFALVVFLWRLVGPLLIYYYFDARLSVQPAGIAVLDKTDWPRTEDGQLPCTFGYYIPMTQLQAWVVIWASHSSLCMDIVVWCEWKIMKRLQNLSDVEDVRIQRTHIEIHRALLAMAICPLVSSAVAHYVLPYYRRTARVHRTDFGPVQQCG